MAKVLSNLGNMVSYTTREKKMLDIYGKNWNESSQSFQMLLTEFKEDFEFYLGKQWVDTVKQELENSGSPALSLNYLKKQVDVVSGSQRQNRADIKVHPIEGGDEEVSEVLTRLIKWVRSDKSAEFTESRVFKDALICGLGWLHPRMDYTMDKLDGDVIIDKCSPFDITPDPHMTKTDLSDCDYIMRHKRVHKEKCKELWPKYEKQIEKQDSQTEHDGIRQDADILNDQGNNLKVVEMWYRKWEKKKIIINAADPQAQSIWEGEEIEDARRQMIDYFANQGQPEQSAQMEVNKEMGEATGNPMAEVEGQEVAPVEDRSAEIVGMDDDELLELVLQTNPDLKVMKDKICIIKLLIVINDQLIVYDGDTPDKTRDFPFVPVFGYYEDSYSDWELKVQGVVRNLKDPQREKNKRRSQIMRAINSMPTSGWLVEDGSVEDVNDYINGAGAGRILTYHGGGRNKPESIRPPDLPQSIMALEQMSDNDMLRQGPNADLMGMQQSSQEAGVTIQLRQKQGMVTLQELFDSLSLSMRGMGRILIELITRNWTIDKCKRILGHDAPYYQSESERKMYEEQVQNIQQQIAQATQALDEASIEQEQSPQGLPEQGLQQAEQGTAQLQEQLTQLLIAEELRQEMEEKFWDRFEDMKKTARFDTHVDESKNSPTARTAGIILMTQFLESGGQVDPMTMLELADIPKEQKDQIRQSEQERKQMAQQQLQMQQQEQERLSQAQLQEFQLEMSRSQQKTQQQMQQHELDMANAQLDLMKTTMEMKKMEIETPQLKKNSQQKQLNS